MLASGVNSRRLAHEMLFGALNRLLPTFPSEQPVILAFHSVPDRWQFEQQMRCLLRLNRTVVSLDQVVEWTAGRCELPRHAVALTFDDGYLDHHTIAASVLRRLHWPATFFVTTSRLGGYSTWDKAGDGQRALRLMAAEQVANIASWGFEVGCHSASHPHFRTSNEAQLREEICSPREVLQQITGTPIRSFCYPYGEWTELARSLVAAAGYEHAVTSEYAAVERSSDVRLLARMTPPEVTVPTEFQAYVTGVAARWVALRQGLIAKPLLARGIRRFALAHQ